MGWVQWIIMVFWERAMGAPKCSCGRPPSVPATTFFFFDTLFFFLLKVAHLSSTGEKKESENPKVVHLEISFHLSSTDGLISGC